MNLPNLLTSIRIVLVPIAYYAGFSHQKELFISVFALGGLTDFLDGFLARTLKQKSEFGSTLDTVADVLFHPTALMTYFFIPQIVVQNRTILLIILALYALQVIVTAMRGKLSRPHVLTAKIAAFTVYVLVLGTLMLGYNPLIFYAAMIIFATDATYKLGIAWRS